MTTPSPSIRVCLLLRPLLLLVPPGFFFFKKEKKNSMYFAPTKILFNTTSRVYCSWNESYWFRAINVQLSIMAAPRSLGSG
jgi:hypothetical protein